MLSLATATMDYKWMTQNEKAYHANDLELFQKFIIPSACKMNIEKWIICNNTTPHDDNPIISYFFRQNHYNDALPTYRLKKVYISSNNNNNNNNFRGLGCIDLRPWLKINDINFSRVFSLVVNINYPDKQTT